MNEIWAHYLEILRDPAHLLVEVTLMLLVDVLFLGLVWPRIRAMVDKRVIREHVVLDEEHGHDHAAPFEWHFS